MANDIVDEPKVEVWITAVVEREFKRREVFPKLRIESAVRVLNASTGVHLLSVAEAEALLEDAEEQCSSRLLARGLPVAFGALREKLDAALKHAKGLWDAPGIEVARQRMQESPAQFRVGDRVRFWSQWTDSEQDGKELQIVQGFGLYEVLCDEGKFIGKDGSRLSYQWGYIAKGRRLEDSSCFYPAYQLQRMDYTRGYLQLVGERPKKEGWRRQG